MSAELSATATVEEILSKKSVIELRELARSFYVKGSSKMRKVELISEVKAALMIPERLEELLYVLDSAAWQTFRKAAESSEPVKLNLTESRWYQILHGLCYLHFITGNRSLSCSVPPEIRTVYDSLVTDGLIQRKKHYDQLHLYALAAANLYGVISQDDFVALFNSQNEDNTSKEELFDALIRHIVVDAGYCFWDKYIVDIGFEDNGFADVSDLLAQIGDKPRYIPEKEEFLKYADWRYFEHNEHSRNLGDYLIHACGVAPLLVPKIVTELHESCMLSESFQNRFDLLAEHGIEFDGDQLNEFIRLLSAFDNSTRLWSNNGHSPNEIFSLYEQKNLSPRPNQSTKKAKIGRNDPCPCGSGLKYKKCCGR
ncbi:MAG: hypothetical protein DBY01_05260 [Eubacterium ventriosum]|nr:MAG: hypothetical protein DBY01_05260 [Eubacterium ventriosum]